MTKKIELTHNQDRLIKLFVAQDGMLSSMDVLRLRPEDDDAYFELRQLGLVEMHPYGGARLTEEGDKFVRSVKVEVDLN